MSAKPSKLACDAEYIMAWCRGHGDLFRTMKDSISEQEELCTTCYLRREDERRRL